MSRSVWKGPFVELSLMKKVQKHKDQNIKKPIKTWSRKSTIIPEFIGMTFEVTITDEMIGHKLGEFSATRQFFGHTPADKKAAPATEKKDDKK
jgi:small subunit ribosomal protein S19